MVTKTKAAAPAALPAAKRRAPRKAVPARASTADNARVAEPPQPAADSAPEPAKANLLRAGLKALGNVRDDVVQHQSRVFEAILGIDPAQGWAGLVRRDAASVKTAAAATEAFGLRKFEAVFDQRVASALERMGMPSVDTLKALTDEVAALKKELRSLKATRKR